MKLKKYEVIVDDVYNKALSRSKVIVEAKDLKEVKEKLRNRDYKIVDERIELGESEHIGTEVVIIKEYSENGNDSTDDANKKGEQDEQN